MNFWKNKSRNILSQEELIGRGRLQIGIFIMDEGHPAENAVVRVSNNINGKIIEELITNSSGQTVEIILPSPPIEFSLESNLPKPYSEYNVSVEMEGFIPFNVEGVQIFPNTTACQDVNLSIATNTTNNSEIVNIPPPVLWGKYPPKIAEEVVKPLPPSTGFVVLPKTVIPEYIVVHDGVPTNTAAKNYWVLFKDYIKNVASCEIYSNWPEATLKANILAIISLTLNRVYTEWYRSKGYPYTITNSTAFDQAFKYGRNIFQEISIIVDDIFSTFITKPNIKQPLFTQYCDGKNSICPTWMSQWGSKDLGDQGYSAVQILKQYYGQDVYLMQAEKVSGVPSSYSGTHLQAGSSGPNVRVIQEQLNRIANNYPAIKKVRIDGIYGQGTLAAVSEFQNIFRLPSTGIVDFGTWYKISQIYVAVAKLAEGV